MFFEYDTNPERTIHALSHSVSYDAFENGCVF